MCITTSKSLTIAIVDFFNVLNGNSHMTESKMINFPIQAAFISVTSTILGHTYEHKFVRHLTHHCNLHGKPDLIFFLKTE